MEVRVTEQRARAQALHAAHELKRIIQGHVINPQTAAMHAAGKLEFTVAVTGGKLKFEMPWRAVEDETEAALADFIFAKMRPHVMAGRPS